MKKELLIGAACVAAIFTAQANAYQFELALARSTTEIENTFDIDTTLLGGEYYFSDVNSNNGPFSEASFLSKASSVNVLLGQSTLGSGFGESGFGGSDSDLLFINGRVVLENDFILVGSFSRSETDDGDDSDATTIGLGKYLSESSELVATYTRDNFGDGDADILELRYHRVIDTGNGTAWSYEAGAGYIDAGDTGFDLDVAANYYFTPKFSLGVLVGVGSFDDSDSKTFGFQAEYFFNENIFLGLLFTTGDESDLDQEQTLIGGGIRF